MFLLCFGQVDAATAEGEEADAAVPGGNSVLKRRTPSLAAEMKAFLDDSDEEGGGGAALGVVLGLGNGASMPGAADSAAGSAAASATDLGLESVSVVTFFLCIMKMVFLWGSLSLFLVAKFLLPFAGKKCVPSAIKEKYENMKSPKGKGNGGTTYKQ